MQELFVKSWEEFEHQLLDLSKRQDDVIKSRLYVSTPLFRGQADAEWSLETTLDRAAPYTVSITEYSQRIRAVQPAVVSLTGKDWPLPEVNYEQDFDFRNLPAYEFMIYLRHHGFPSPLLDWSRSPYVAAYFAFRFGTRAQPANVAIYSYVEHLGGRKTYRRGEPHIFCQGPYVISHRRHYTQQCEYTICAKRIEGSEGEDVYARHEEHKIDTDCERLVKIIIPSSERTKVMDRLQLMNITAFSLFGSEESLMETLAYTEIEKRMLCRAPEQ